MQYAPCAFILKAVHLRTICEEAARVDFPLSIIVFCLEGQDAAVSLPSGAEDILFAYAATAADGTGEDGALCESAPHSLLVTTIERAREIAEHGPRTRPVLAIAPPAAGAEPRSGTGQHGNPEDAVGAEARSASQDPALPFPIAVTPLSCAAVCNLINRRLVELRDWNEELGDLILKGCSCQQLIDASEPIIGHYLALSDALFAFVAATRHHPPLDDMSRALLETGSYPSSMIPRIERIAEEQRWHAQNRSRLDQEGNGINPYPNITRVYRLERIYAAHLVMVAESPIQPWEQFLFDVLADRIGACLKRFWKTSSTYRDKSAAFLAALIEGDIGDPVDIPGKAKRFDVPASGVFELCVVAGAEEHGGIAHFAHQIRLTLKECRVTTIGQSIYVLLISSRKSSGKIAAMESQLFGMVARLHAEMGVSSRFEQLSSCRMARMEADVALQYGSKNRSKYLALADKDPYLTCVFRFNRYFPCYLVDPYADTAQFLAEYAKSPNLVNRLRAADAENGTDDFGLLKIYLYFDCSIKKTAELLGMHRNTVVYRLNKVRNDFYIDLDDCDTRLFLHYLFGVLD